ncbi:MAG TPA: outer membrane protein assembly factor BamE [Hyphomicrobium sp.]|uniref:outer membrane protein assembly factor BamE n=1 Tax=Hyphomicrobium sp. TaxID=82 RepID=UPI002CE3087C|nr:outer membrane protein assembly factor BamE [Hyphomicrobium sp.]HXE01957.1 outer membrane protein assembly factor BamE [Hyphomicrobium sp.]
MRQNDPTSPRLAALLRTVAIASLVTFSGVTLSGCSETITKHGQLFRQTDLQSVQPGMSKEQVRSTLGTPATTAVVGDGHAFYYISSTQAQSSFFLPKETDRQVVAVYFNQGGTVDSIANYGLKDGKVFDFVSRQTPAPGSKDEGILKSLFRNLGKKQLFGE